eukprot:TRINITY_DN66384_c0_g1_i1.p1 TRINITY_DN66384_c0_g1~~TRINITY_DN66384_c0_g1_i1.p1  ORF type:complete len:295 (+),score=58.45 TRINITY_DN66384_c0_g1_i1:93-977(+)
MAAARPVLSYFSDNKGRNELTRLIFALGHIDYINEEISPFEYLRRRDSGELPYGQIPTLRLADGSVLGQSCAIARYAARLAALYPEDAAEAAKADAVVDAWRDQLDQFYDVVFERAVIGGKLQMFPRPQVQRAEMLQTYLHFSFQPWLLQMETQLTDGFVCAPKLSFADLAIFDLVCTIEGIVEQDVLNELMESHTRVSSLVAQIGKLPEIVQHLGQHPYNDIRHLVATPHPVQQRTQDFLFPLLKMMMGAWAKTKGCFEGCFHGKRAPVQLPAAIASHQQMPSLLQAAPDKKL